MTCLAKEYPRIFEAIADGAANAEIAAVELLRQAAADAELIDPAWANRLNRALAVLAEETCDLASLPAAILTTDQMLGRLGDPA